MTTELTVAGFTALTALSESKDPNRASIPFDKERSGFVMGEGAGIVVLEEYEHAKARGPRFLRKLLGTAPPATHSISQRLRNRGRLWQEPWNWP